jgi:hypothetical protein
MDWKDLTRREIEVAQKPCPACGKAPREHTDEQSQKCAEKLTRHLPFKWFRKDTPDFRGET